MSLYDAKAPEEIEAELAKQYPDKLEFEPGKFADYDEARGCWVYHDPAGPEIEIRI